MIKEGGNRLGDFGKLYFPGRGEFVRIEPELFPDEDPDLIRTLHWSPVARRLVATTPYRLWAAPLERVLVQPRYRADTGRKIRA